MNLQNAVFTEPLFMRELLIFSCKNNGGTFSLAHIVESFDSSENKKIVLLRDLNNIGKLMYMPIDKFNSVMEIQYTEYPHIDTSLPIEQYMELFNKYHMEITIKTINEIPVNTSQFD